MIYKKLSKKHYIIIATIMVIILAIGGVWFGVVKSRQSTRPNPTPGSGNALSAAKKAEQEKKQKEQTQELNKILANTPKDKKSVCIATSKFYLEQQHKDFLKQIDDINQRMIKRLSDSGRSTKTQEYTHANQTKRENDRYQKSLDNIKCKD